MFDENGLLRCISSLQVLGLNGRMLKYLTGRGLNQ